MVTHVLAFLLHVTSAILAFMAMPESGLQLGKLVVPEVDFKAVTTLNQTSNTNTTTLEISEMDHIVFEDINVVGLIFI